MIDHALGRPSPGWKRSQVLLTTLGLLYLIRRGDGLSSASWLYKRFGRPLDRFFRHARPWKVVLSTLTAMYVANHALLLLFLNPPEPLARMYTRNFFRATWIMTALDAGFLTAAKLKPKFVRDLAGPLLSLVFMFFPDTSDNICRKYRYTATIDVMRTSWEKSTNPWLHLFTFFDRGFLRIREDISIPVPNPPSASVFNGIRPPRTAIKARLYFDGSREQLQKTTRLIFHIHGGGFVTMSPKNHDDYVSHWARRVQVPILSVDYGTAPENPYPWALEECFEAYRSVVETNGEVLGMEGWYSKDEKGRALHRNKPIRIVVCGDSAGGNLAAALVIKCIEAAEGPIDLPAAVILIYPALSFDMTCWMPNNQLRLLRTETHPSRQLSEIIRHKLMIRQDAPLATSDAPRSIDVLHDRVDRTPSWYYRLRPKAFEPTQGVEIPTSLSMTSRMTYFTDRIIQPEMMRAMAVMYLANSPVIADIAKDYKLSPIIAPEWILARFPKTYFITGEKDPLVDDTVVFAARIRDAKMRARREFEYQRSKIGLNGRFTTPDSIMEEDDLGLTISRRCKSAGILSAQHPDEVSNMSMNMYDSTASLLSENNSSRYKSPHSQHNRRHHIPPFTFTDEELSTGFVPFLSHFVPDEIVHVKILEGMSHAFFNMISFLPETKQAIHLVSHWFNESFQDGRLSTRWEDFIHEDYNETADGEDIPKEIIVEDGGQDQRILVKAGTGAKYDQSSQNQIYDSGLNGKPPQSEDHGSKASEAGQIQHTENDDEATSSDSTEEDEEEGISSYSHALYPIHGVHGHYEPILRRTSQIQSPARDSLGVSFPMSPFRPSSVPISSLNDSSPHRRISTVIPSQSESAQRVSTNTAPSSLTTPAPSSSMSMVSEKELLRKRQTELSHRVFLQDN